MTILTYKPHSCHTTCFQITLNISKTMASNPSSTRTSVQSRLASKASQSQAPPVTQSTTADPILANIVARLKAQAMQAGGGRGDCQPGGAQPGRQAVYDPFSQYHKQVGFKKVMTKESKTGSIMKMTSTDISKCICNRPMQLVMCQHCGMTFRGRVKKSCPTHPSVTYLMDVVACRGCKMTDVEALKEFPVTL